MSGSQTRDSQRPHEQLLVLVVDDYDDSREMYAEFFELSGFQVAQARDGAQSLQKALELVPDVILMDLALPGMDGWEAIKHLRANARTRHIPVVALTGHDARDAVAAAEPPGWDALVTKPCLPENLVEEVERVLAHRTAHNGDGARPLRPIAS
jgi:two-component system, cell cycle response regulator DivK